MPKHTDTQSEAARLSQEAYKAAKANLDTITYAMSKRTVSLFNETLNEARERVNVVGEKAMAEAVQKLAANGIYASTHTDKNGKGYRVPADVAVRQAVYTSGRQRFNGQVLGIAQRTGQDLIEVSSTPNCRPSHEVINGKIFSLSGQDSRYPKWTADLEALTHDYNCGHSVAIYHEGHERVFSNPLEGTGYTVEEARKAFSKQRAYENEIRKQKRVVETLKAAGLDTREANAKLNTLRHRLQRHIDANNKILRRERHREQLYDSAQRMKKKLKAAFANRVKTGAFNGALNNKNDPYFRRRDEHAERYYAAVRNRDKQIEIAAVASASAKYGVSKDEVFEAYEHLFEDKHELDGVVRYFDPSYDIAASWQRLREGKDVKPHDITLLKHEALERKFMARGMSYDQAHEEAEKSYNYAKEANEFNARGDDGLR